MASANPWNALLESLHSAMIDELTERCPEPKPILGMPIRQKDFTFPEAMETFISCEVELEKDSGLVGLGYVWTAPGKKTVAIQTVWTGILNRAPREFGFRGIAPVLKTSRLLASPQTPPAIQTSRTIWIPIETVAGKFLLVIGML